MAQQPVEAERLRLQQLQVVQMQPAAQSSVNLVGNQNMRSSDNASNQNLQQQIVQLGARSFNSFGTLNQ